MNICLTLVVLDGKNDLDKLKQDTHYPNLTYSEPFAEALRRHMKKYDLTKVEYLHPDATFTG